MYLEKNHLVEILLNCNADYLGTAAASAATKVDCHVYVVSMYIYMYCSRVDSIFAGKNNRVVALARKIFMKGHI